MNHINGENQNSKKKQTKINMTNISWSEST